MNEKNTTNGIEEKLRSFLSKMQGASSYEAFCEMLGQAVYEKIHEDEITEFQFGNYIVEALLTNDANRVFGAFAGVSAEIFPFSSRAWVSPAA